MQTRLNYLRKIVSENNHPMLVGERTNLLALCGRCYGSGLAGAWLSYAGSPIHITRQCRPCNGYGSLVFKPKRGRAWRR